MPGQENKSPDPPGPSPTTKISRKGRKIEFWGRKIEFEHENSTPEHEKINSGTGKWIPRAARALPDHEKPGKRAENPEKHKKIDSLRSAAPGRRPI